MAGLFYEDFVVGQEIHHPISRTVTEADNTLFSVMTMNPQPLHLDAHFAAKTEFGQRIVNSMFTLSTLIGMSVYDTTLGTTVAESGHERDFQGQCSTAILSRPTPASSPNAKAAPGPTPASWNWNTGAPTKMAKSSLAASERP